MPRVLRFICLGILLLLLQANGCDDENPRGNKPRPSPSATPPSTAIDTSTSPTPTVTATSTRLSGIATRTGVTITRDGQPIDSAGLQAIGWDVHADIGEASWTDPSLGNLSVTWELPDARAVAFFDVSLWGEVTGANLAMNPSMSAGVFKGGPVEAAAHSVGGTTAKTPVRAMRVHVPEQPPGTQATVAFNLGFPVPILVTYTYVYE